MHLREATSRHIEGISNENGLRLLCVSLRRLEAEVGCGAAAAAAAQGERYLHRLPGLADILKLGKPSTARLGSLASVVGGQSPPSGLLQIWPAKLTTMNRKLPLRRAAGERTEANLDEPQTKPDFSNER